MTDTKDKRDRRIPATLEEFMALALAMENEAVERYNELADTLEVHRNREVAAMFRKMAGYEAKHAARIMMQMNWTTAPPLPQATAMWAGLEAAETVPYDEIHYLMLPWHALQLALAAEERAERFFGELAKVADTASIQRAAREMQAEEAEHVRLVKEWLAKVPQPEGDWAHDPDPPRHFD